MSRWACKCYTAILQFQWPRNYCSFTCRHRSGSKVASWISKVRPRAACSSAWQGLVSPLKQRLQPSACSTTSAQASAQWMTGTVKSRFKPECPHAEHLSLWREKLSEEKCGQPPVEILVLTLLVLLRSRVAAMHNDRLNGMSSSPRLADTRVTAGGAAAVSVQLLHSRLSKRSWNTALSSASQASAA